MFDLLPWGVVPGHSPVKLETPPRAQRPHKSLCTPLKAWHTGLSTAQRGAHAAWGKCVHPHGWGYPHLLWKRIEVPGVRPVQSRDLLVPAHPDPGHPYRYSSLLHRTSLELALNGRGREPQGVPVCWPRPRPRLPTRGAPQCLSQPAQPEEPTGGPHQGWDLVSPSFTGGTPGKEWVAMETRQWSQVGYF